MSENTQDLRKVTQRRRPPHGPGARMMPGEKAKDFKGTIAKLVRFMGQFKVSLASSARRSPSTLSARLAASCRDG